MSDQLDLFNRPAPVYCVLCGANPCACNESADLTIDQRFELFATGNKHVLQAALELARKWLAEGRSYVSAKAIYEVLRNQVRSEEVVAGRDAYKLNNDFTAPLARWLIAQEPKLDGVIRLRERKR